ncbi:hypothetical protein GQ54DRAFT_299276 [Martensiomyces pterosporus]|nr:hypothetical protein GQ54DRAFT_299276 [Martensiomyces pterosporus]
MKKLAQRIHGQFQRHKPRRKPEKYGGGTAARPTIRVLPIDDDDDDDDEENTRYHSTRRAGISRAGNRDDYLEPQGYDSDTDSSAYYYTSSEDENEDKDSGNGWDDSDDDYSIGPDSTAHVRTLMPPTEGGFDRDEWQKKAAGALFGSARPRSSSKATHSEPHGGSKRPTIYTTAWLHGLRRTLDGRLNLSEPGRDACVNALNELLFKANSWVDSQQTVLVDQYTKRGRSVSKFALDFESMVDTAFAEFAIAAESILAIVGQMDSRPSVSSDRSSRTFVEGVVEPRMYPDSLLAEPLSKQPLDSMECLLSGIISTYADRATAHSDALTTPRKPGRSTLCSDTALTWDVSDHEESTLAAYAIDADDLECTLERFGIDVVKYSKEQLRLYAKTSVCKTVTSQMLLSTGIENELIDRMEEEQEALQTIEGNIDLIQARVEHAQDREKDLWFMRRKAAQKKRAMLTLEAEAKQASFARRIYESLFTRISSM